MKRILKLQSLVLLATLLAAGFALANPIPQWFLRDTPVGNPNGVWDDQWSGGTVNPPGEIITWEPPPWDHPCGDDPFAASIAPIGAGENALRVYTDPPYEDTQAEGNGIAVLSLRQTCFETATVEVALYRVDAEGGNPILLTSASQNVGVGGWPPTVVPFDLMNVPETPMNGGRFLLLISTPDGQCTDLVWDCADWDCWITLPEQGSAVEQSAWGAVKARYR
jgi:hypothetical protein